MMDLPLKDHVSYSPWIGGDLCEWEPLLRGFQPIAYKKNTVIYNQRDVGNSVFIVDKGRVRVVVYHPSGSEKHIYIAEQGCLIGESAILAGELRHTAAQAIVDSALYKIPAQTLETVMLGNPALAMSVARLLSKKSTIYIDQLSELAFSQSYFRVINALVNLSRQYGEKTSDGIRIGIKFTHEDISRLVNTSRVTVSNVFNQLVEEDTIVKINGYYVIKSIDKLLSTIRQDMEG